MIRYLIKNNFKIMTRSATNIFLFIATPLILIALLSAAFNDMMKKYEDSGSFEAGYRIEGQGMSSEMEDAFLRAAADRGITFREYKDSEPEEILRREAINTFVVFEDGTYTVYETNESKEQSKALEYLVGSFYEQTAAAMTGMEGPEASGQNKDAAGQGPEASGQEPEASSQNKDSGKLRVEHPEFMASIDSADYYGIIEVIYIGWCAIICGAGLFSAEKKYGINKKLRVSGISESKFYLSRYIPMLLAVLLGTALTVGLSILLFGIHWGNPLLSALVILFSSAAACAFGLMVYSITENMVLTIILVFSIVWVAGFCGGSFETYMFSSLPDTLKKISPIYHINRSLVEMSCMGSSDYTTNALLYSGGITIVCSAVSILAGKLRKRGKA